MMHKASITYSDIDLVVVAVVVVVAAVIVVVVAVVVVVVVVVVVIDHCLSFFYIKFKFRITSE